jgi:hypothetical protein
VNDQTNDCCGHACGSRPGEPALIKVIRLRYPDDGDVTGQECPAMAQTVTGDTVVVRPEERVAVAEHVPG